MKSKCCNVEASIDGGGKEYDDEVQIFNRVIFDKHKKQIKGWTTSKVKGSWSRKAVYE